MQKFTGSYTRCIGLAVAAAGCDDQAGPGYYGESLLTVSGSVEIAHGQPRGALTPALAFPGKYGSTIQIVDVPVRGTFPSDFRLDVYGPPPEVALVYATRHREGEPRVGAGYITAVTSDHPDVLYEGNSISSVAHDCEPQGRSDDLCLTREMKVCVVPAGITPCYVEKTLCPSRSLNANDCIIEKSGDPALTKHSLDYFSGFSQNYLVLYFEHSARAGSATAYFFDSENGIPEGYGLYEVHLSTEDDIAMLAPECQNDAAAYVLAAEMYNAAHGTDYKTLVCHANPEDPAFCNEPSSNEDFDDETGVRGEVNRLVEKARMQLGCPLSRVQFERVGDPAHTSISVVIDAKPPLSI